MIDAIAWDLANNSNSPTNDVDIEPTLFEKLENMFTQHSTVIETRVIIAFEGDVEGAEILFCLNQDQSGAEIVAYWESNEIINFGDFEKSVVEEMEQKDLDSLFTVLDLKLR